MLPLLLLKISLLISPSLQASEGCPLKEGDIIFIKSQTNQARLLSLTTESEWSHVGILLKKNDVLKVAEAVQPVKWTNPIEFIKRSKKFEFVVKRPRFEYNVENIKNYVESKMKLDYDLIFSWDDKRFYCTELIWKAFNEDNGEVLGELQQIKDLKNIDNPLIKKEAQKRFNQYNEPYNHEEWKESLIITPIQMMNSSKLKTISTSATVEDLVDCQF